MNKQSKFLSGEYNPQANQEVIKVLLRDHNTFDEYFHAFILAVMANPKRLIVDYIPYSRADKELNGEINASLALLKFVDVNFNGELHVNGRIHDRKWTRKAREFYYQKESLNDYVIALDETEVNSNYKTFNNHFKKVRTDGKVVSQELFNKTIKSDNPIKRLVLRDDILGGGATIKLALDYLWNNFYGLMVEVDSVVIDIDYNEGIHINYYEYITPQGTGYLIPIKNKHMLLSDKNMIKTNNDKYNNKEKRDV